MACVACSWLAARRAAMFLPLLFIGSLRIGLLRWPPTVHPVVIAYVAAPKAIRPQPCLKRLE
jgi:hypothetical protein